MKPRRPRKTKIKIQVFIGLSKISLERESPTTEWCVTIHHFFSIVASCLTFIMLWQLHEYFHRTLAALAPAPQLIPAVLLLFILFRSD